MKRSRLISLLSFFVLLSSLNAFAITDEELFRNFQFSFVNPGARSTAMGGAFIALADDATAAEANPAGLTILTKPEVSIEYRNTRFDEDKLNSFEVLAPSVSTLSDNKLEDLNQPSFLSAVFPAGGSVYAFSRHESVRLQGDVNQLFRVVSEGTPVTVGALGTTDQTVVNYNFSIATKFSDNFSVGGSLRYSQLKWETLVENFGIIEFPDGSTFQQEFFNTRIDSDDSALGFNVGVLWRLGQHVTTGVVYKQNPKFEVDEREVDVINPRFNETFTNVLKIPDTLGAGISIKPNDSITLNGDVVFIQYSDLLEGIATKHNVLTRGLEGTINYEVENAVEYHVGAEFVVFLKNIPIAVRQGYFRKPSNTLVFKSATGQAGQLSNALAVLFTGREDENHFTFGNGFVFGQHFQVDWAVDLADISDNFVVSSVVRF